MRIGIIGGGAAGLMAAATIRETDPNIDIVLIERNDGLGKKVLISGGGRCNVTTGIQNVQTVLTKYPRGTKFLAKAMRVFSPLAVYEWFEAHGVALKTEEDLRVFPQSDDGHDIVGVFERLLDPRSVLLKTSVARVERQGNRYAVHCKNRAEPIVVDKLILTTGGQAYRATGSQGDGYAFAQSLGHTITKLAPSLSAFYASEAWPATLAGSSFAYAEITALRGKRPSQTGPMIFTHKGVSGPAIFALSSLIAFEEFSKERPLLIRIDARPDTAEEVLVEEMGALAAEHGAKSLLNVLSEAMPRKIALLACEEAKLDPNEQAARVSKSEYRKVASWLKAMPLTVIGRDAGEEFVTAGGVDTHEVDPQTMESKISPGLYFAGEILDIDGFTGGFNLQASWATGHLAGESAAASA